MINTSKNHPESHLSDLPIIYHGRFSKFATTRDQLQVNYTYTMCFEYMVIFRGSDTVVLGAFRGLDGQGSLKFVF